MALHVGTSGFAYPSWRGSFYPPDARPSHLLRHYADRLDAVELHGAFRRLPEVGQFRRWAEQTPPGFRFAVKMTGRITHGRDLRLLPVFTERVRVLGERLGPVLVQLECARDDGFLTELLASLDADLRYAVELKHGSWLAPEVDALLTAHRVARVGSLDHPGALTYLRLREPPFPEAFLDALATQLRPLLAENRDVHCYFRHEDEPRGALAAVRLRELLGAA